MDHTTELVKAGQVMSGFDMEDTYMVVCSCGHRSTKARVFKRYFQKNPPVNSYMAWVQEQKHNQA